MILISINIPLTVPFSHDYSACATPGQSIDGPGIQAVSVPDLYETGPCEPQS